MKRLFSLFLLGTILIACNSESKKSSSSEKELHKVVAQEVLHVKEYSYIRVLEDGNELWVAAPTTPVEIGGTYYYGKTMKMENFESKDLNKTFDKVYFVEKFSTTEEGLNQAPATSNPAAPATDPHAGMNIDASQGQKPAIEKKAVEVKKAKGAISLAELFQNKEKYKGQKVIVTGEVAKFNPAIMNTNWIHIQDGSEFEGEFDLTVTTNETAQVGDILTLQGTVTLNKDFGAGYYYKIIIENAIIIK
ncbi:hypothetical protein [Lutimonas zeaxanthinifaciens]|uniref:hypothetical protein n=1 Tax=Lutimonas zeaxanthinifaciens TaxID=3060215 RepID=UPI00265CA5C4|nr:hypothetical protein [Lutimonas sp. YSD2104]WKK67283.1 hypothetical protein QZH61_06570 [Lutimonas sp. YSD2104]